MSECGIDGPPEQETSSTRANTRANDKWAQEATRGPMGKVGGATAKPADLLVGRPTGRPTRPMGPTASTLPCGASLLLA